MMRRIMQSKDERLRIIFTSWDPQESSSFFFHSYTMKRGWDGGMSFLSLSLFLDGLKERTSLEKVSLKCCCPIQSWEEGTERMMMLSRRFFLLFLSFPFFPLFFSMYLVTNSLISSSFSRLPAIFSPKYTFSHNILVWLNFSLSKSLFSFPPLFHPSLHLSPYFPLFFFFTFLSRQ